MLFKKLLILATLFSARGQQLVEKVQAAQDATGRTLDDYEFEYQTSYNGLVLTMKDELIEQLKNTMLSAVLDQEFMQSLLSNYWSI